MNASSVIPTPEQLESEAAAWVRAYRTRHGRPPRILHIGNIANNAYNNAKLLIRLGCECDVLCFDYYHIMGCPEWEDADFRGSIRDHFFADWRSVELNGFRRPEWFAQGPMAMCLSYLAARNSLAAANQLRGQALSDAPAPVEPPGRMVRWRVATLRWLLEVTRWQATHRRWRLWRRRLSALAVRRPPLGALGLWIPRGIRQSLRHLVGHALLAAFHLLLALVSACALLAYLVTYPIRKALPLRPSPAALAPELDDGYDFDERVRALTAEFARQFPDRTDQLTADDLECYRGCVRPWRRLLAQYDIVQGYATDGIYPLLADRQPYFAFEHGTLREIPFQATSQGRAAALTFRMARHVFVTNADCLDNARTLAGDNVTFLNHPYDEDHGLNVTEAESLRSQLQRDLRCEFLILFPTRHDWVQGTGYADKANDVFLRAFARLRQDGWRVGMICCRWGNNVEESRRLVASLGCAEAVRWVEPMGVVQFDRMVRACHVVADQFKLGAFGGVLFKAMANGTPVCTYLDEQKLQRQYGQPPPVLNCATESEIVQSLSAMFSDPQRLAEVGRRSRQWMKLHHGGGETAARQVLQYARVLEPQCTSETPLPEPAASSFPEPRITACAT